MGAVFYVDNLSVIKKYGVVMKISLINVSTLDGNNVVPPLGIMYVAASARQAGHEVQLLDIDPDYQSNYQNQLNQMMTAGSQSIPIEAFYTFDNGSYTKWKSQVKINQQ